MKPKKTLLLTCTLIIAMLVSAAVQAQQKSTSLPARQYPQNRSFSKTADYSYKLYSAPNNMYGYNIYKDGKPVYHQFVLMYVTKEGKRLIATKLQTEKAAAIAIGKIRKGEPPVLSGDELKTIIAR